MPTTRGKAVNSSATYTTYSTLLTLPGGLTPSAPSQRDTCTNAHCNSCSRLCTWRPKNLSLAFRESSHFTEGSLIASS